MNEFENMDDELKDAPSLKNMSRSNPFNVPDGYFDSLPVLISAKVSSRQSKSSWIVLFQHFFNPKYVWSACLLTVLITSGIIYFSQHKSLNEKAILVSYDVLNNSGYIEQFDESVLIETYAVKLTTENATVNNNTAIENYLIENQTDISLIENEL